MKIIDLLNKIANGEEVPKKIKYNNIDYYWCSQCKIYERFEDGSIDLYNDLDNLNDEVGILDDEEDKESETSIKLFVDGKEICSLDYTGDKEAYKEKLKEFKKTINNIIGEDKAIPLIPDDELWKIENNDATNYRLNYNFKVLKEKINQVVKEFNEYRKENK